MTTPPAGDLLTAAGKLRTPGVTTINGRQLADLLEAIARQAGGAKAGWLDSDIETAATALAAAINHTGSQT